MRWYIVMGVAAVVFGALTLLSGASVLFGPQAIRSVAGDVVLPVLWFNFLSGAIYILAGLGILTRQTWAPWLAWSLCFAIGLMVVVLVVLAMLGTPWEPRTFFAMALRLSFWTAVSLSLRNIR